MFPYKHVMAFLSKAETTYIFPTELKPIFKFFLKSRNLKSLITSLKSHSTEERTALIELLKSSICGVRTAFLKGAWRWTLSGYAGSPYRHKGWPAGSKEFVANSLYTPESASIPLSCFLPSSKTKMKNIII